MCMIIIKKNTENPVRALWVNKYLWVYSISMVRFISPPNVYMSSTGLVPGSIGGYTARWCQRAV